MNKKKLLKILAQAAGERAAGNLDAAKNMEDQVAALQAKHNLPADDAGSVRRAVESIWNSIPPSTRVLIWIKEPGMVRSTKRPCTMAEALPLLKAEQAIFAGYANGSNEFVRRLRPDEVGTILHRGKNDINLMSNLSKVEDQFIEVDVRLADEQQRAKPKEKMWWW